MLNQKNTDNILYNKPYQLVLWTISMKRKMHTRSHLSQLVLTVRERGFFLIATLGKPPLWASVKSTIWKDWVYSKLSTIKSVRILCVHMIISCPSPNLSVLNDRKSFVHYENPTGSRALGKDEGCQTRRQETKPKSRSCKIITFPFTKGN